ncbi:hypothetical protein HY493_00160 [Candidatus Woesearchaeota archaeon]|nr:hypothetical protein [Candidatus Woesearchaeota archaeon]
MDEPTISFGLSFHLSPGEDGLKKRVKFINEGVPREVVLTLIRSWLRHENDDYQKSFDASFND